MAASLQGDIKSMINTSFSQLVYLFQAQGHGIVFYIVSDPCAGHLIKVLLCLSHVIVQMYILVYWSTFKPGCFCLSKLMKGLHTMQQKPADFDLAELLFSFPPPKQVSQ